VREILECRVFKAYYATLLMASLVNKLVKQHPLEIGTTVLSALLGLAAADGKLESFRPIFDPVFRAGVRVSSKGEIEIRTWFLGLTFIICFSFLMSLVFIVRSELRRRRAPRKSGVEGASDTLHQMLMGLSAIVDRSTPVNGQATYSLASVRYRYLIKKDFSGAVRREQEIFTREHPVYWCPAEVGVFSEAQPIKYLDELELRLEQQRGREIVCLPAEIDRFRKRFVFFFLPRIDPQDSAPCKLIFEYKWPGMWNRLKYQNLQKFTWVVQSRDPIPLINFEIYVDPALGMELEWAPSGPNYDEAEIERVFDTKLEWPGFKYTIKKAPAGRREYGLILKAGKRQLAARVGSAVDP